MALIFENDKKLTMDIDFDQVFYITDTGRKWDGNKVSVRDKVTSKIKLSFHSTDDIITAFKTLDKDLIIHERKDLFHWSRQYGSKSYWWLNCQRL